MPLSVIAGHSRPKDGVLSHAYVPAIPVIGHGGARLSEMAGTSPAMTNCETSPAMTGCGTSPALTVRETSPAVAVLWDKPCRLSVMIIRGATQDHS